MTVLTDISNGFKKATGIADGAYANGVENIAGVASLVGGGMLLGSYMTAGSFKKNMTEQAYAETKKSLPKPLQIIAPN